MSPTKRQRRPFIIRVTEDTTLEACAKPEANLSPDSEERREDLGFADTVCGSKRKWSLTGYFPLESPTKRQRHALSATLLGDRPPKPEKSCCDERPGYVGQSPDRPTAAQKLGDHPEDSAACSVCWMTIRGRIQSGDLLAPLLRKLEPGQCLNDDVIDTILASLPQNSRIETVQTCFLYENSKPKVHRLPLTVTTEQLLAPVCRDHHWVLLDVHVKKNAIYLYDSLSAQSSFLAKKHWTYSVCEDMAKTVDEAFKDAGRPKQAWTFYCHVQQTMGGIEPCLLSQQQSNWFDCGVFLLHNARCLKGATDPRNGLFVPDEWRLKWAEEIIGQKSRPELEDGHARAQNLRQRPQSPGPTAQDEGELNNDPQDGTLSTPLPSTSTDEPTPPKDNGVDRAQSLARLSPATNSLPSSSSDENRKKATSEDIVGQESSSLPDQGIDIFWDGPAFDDPFWTVPELVRE